MIQFYSIFDKKAVSFSPPFQAKHIAEATRAVVSALDDPKSTIARWPADFALYLVGHFNPETGTIMPTSSGIPQLTMECAALLPPERMVPTPKEGA